MRPFLIAATVSAVILPIASCAPTTSGPTPGAETPARRCFYTDQISNFRTSEATRSVYVKTYRGDVYALSALGPCFGLDSASTLAFAPRMGGSQLCLGDSADLLLPSASGPGQCSVRVERSLTAEDVEALPSRDRP